ncbi:MAG: HlyC/CorC family transporter [Lachnospiraceae bacterium]|nr:HlyC/CorC family transporter [Lachnospiraceae bacterium]
MDIHLAIQLLILLLLLLLSFFFSSAETALTTVNVIKIRTLADEGNKRAAKVLMIKEDPAKMLSAILIGNNLVNLSASSLATSVAIRLMGSYGAGLATGILTLLILIFGEITPKNLATLESVKLSLRYAGVIWTLMEILTPLIRLINSLAIGILHIFGVDVNGAANAITERELRTMVDVTHESGAIEEEEKEYIHNVFDFSDTMAREIMIPRIDMTMVDVNWSYDRLLSVFSKNMFTRIPVYEETTDNIIGIINMKDLLLLERDRPFIMRKYLRKPFFTFEQKNTSELFEEMREGSISMAIVLDEFGAVAGLVTLEDLLEELVGEIRDEFDSYEEDDIVQINDREYDVLGTTNLDDLMEEIPLGFTSEDYDTIGGYLTGLFDHFPAVGETYVTQDGAILSVSQASRRRIGKVHIKLPAFTAEAKASADGTDLSN